MSTMAWTDEKFFTKVVVTSVSYIILLSIVTNNNFSLIKPTNANEINITQKTYFSQSVSERPSINVDGLSFDFALEKQNWDKSVRERYYNGGIKTINDGVKHIKLTKYINSRPVKINVIEINSKLNPNLEVKPVTASSATLTKKATIRTLASKNSSLVAINGTFFKPQTGVPLGTLMINKQILTGPIYNRVAMGIGDGYYQMAKVQLDAKLKSGGLNLKIDNINQPRMLSTYVLMYDKNWGQEAPPPPKYGVNIAVVDNKLIRVSYGSTPIPEGGYIISGPKSKLEPFFNAKNIKTEIKTTPFWEGINHIISGGPYLVKDNQVYVDIQEEKFNSISGRNPRTAIGYTEDNNFIMVTVDGREENSVGMTLYELAKFMKGLGCVNAMNLDGGGSSVMYVDGYIVNNPSIKGGIAISNALTLNIVPDELVYKDDGRNN